MNFSKKILVGLFTIGQVLAYAALPPQVVLKGKVIEVTTRTATIKTDSGAVRVFKKSLPKGTQKGALVVVTVAWSELHEAN